MKDLLLQIGFSILGLALVGVMIMVIIAIADKLDLEPTSALMATLVIIGLICVIVGGLMP